MQIFIDKTKGDYIYNDWDAKSFNAMNLKFKELENQGYKEQNVDMDYMNTYYYYQNDKGNAIVVTLMNS